jgi:hypothetical protein
VGPEFGLLFYAEVGGPELGLLLEVEFEPGGLRVNAVMSLGVEGFGLCVSALWLSVDIVGVLRIPNLMIASTEEEVVLSTVFRSPWWSLVVLGFYRIFVVVSRFQFEFGPGFVSRLF